MLDVYSTNLLVLNVGNEGMIHNINNHPIPPIPIHSRLSTSKPKVCGNLTHPHCVKVSRGCSFSYGHPISWGSTHTAVYKPLVTDWWTFPKMNGTNAVLGKMIVFSGRKILTEHKSHLVPICFWVKQKHHGIMFIDFTQHFARRRKPDQKHVLFNCACVYQAVFGSGKTLWTTAPQSKRHARTSKGIWGLGQLGMFICYYKVGPIQLWPLTLINGLIMIYKPIYNCYIYKC